ncbi:acylneuraminate cytidylyltransferase family protein [Mucilaginibacter roseus]|uniref:Acylneuraminate cytidylyltransferase family protein n=1 Tax=Mucilaginibacter roseus TaxID=1528868 RepID=A0ABS8U0B0_9SPHI|nr:acylneuraminate cytidylyltransferase family protein [Mucilaginibacter roseus]MCD8740545.1 acylneuraminate cytidylyltransferase family protein [Mucilaginibacter roseus]
MEKKSIVLAITPARGGSKGVPRKNIIDLGGKPLVAHTITQAKKAALIDEYIVNSEDEEIRQVAEKWGANTMTRPDMYAHDQILQEVDLLLKWTVEQFEEANPDKHVDIVVLLYPTAPLRNVSAIDAAIDLVKNQGYDSALSLYYDTRYLWSVTDEGTTVEPRNYDPNKRMPRQKESWNQWAENKAIYATKRDILFSIGRIGPKCGYVEMEKWRSIDIDEPVDLEMARALYQAKKDILDS